MKSKQQEVTYGFKSNMKFMLQKQWEFEKKAFFSSLLYVIFEVAVSMVTILVPKIILDMIHNEESEYHFVLSVIAITLGWMLFKFISYYSEQGMLKNTAKILNRYFYIKKDQKILDMDYPVVTSPKGKELIEKGHDATSRNILVNMASFYPNITYLLKNILGFVSYGTIILVFNPIVIIFLVISYLLDAYVSFKVEEWEHKKKDQRAKIDKEVYYTLDEINDTSYVKDIKTYSMKQWINNKADKYIFELYKLENEIQSKHFLQMLFEIVLTIIRNGGAYAILLWKMLTTDMTIGDFTLYFGAITGFAQWLEQIVKNYKSLMNANYLVDDYRYLQDTKGVLNHDKGKMIPDITSGMEIVLDHVSFGYQKNERQIINDFNLKINKGEKIAIVGENGAGKTTLIKLICGLLIPTKGRILVNGVDIKEVNRDEYYSLITAVFQNVSVLPMSICENITFLKQGYNETKLKESIEKAGLNEKIHSLKDGYMTTLLPAITGDGVNLSGGEMQRLMLARALYKDSPIMILDEPTAALDPIAEKKLYEKYSNLTHGKTSIFISHRLSSTRFCDKILFISDGKVCETGTHDELMQKGGKYKEIFDVQSQYYKETSGEIQYD